MTDTERYYPTHDILGEEGYEETFPNRTLPNKIVKEVEKHSAGMFIIGYSNGSYTAQAYVTEEALDTKTFSSLQSVDEYIQKYYPDFSSRYHKSILSSGEYIYNNVKAQVEHKFKDEIVSIVGRMRELAMLENRYSQWTRTCQDYYEDPEDWGNAYSWLDDHPIFWRCETYETDGKITGAYWYTSGGNQGINISVNSKGREPRVMMEHGEVLDFTSFCHDIDIESYTHDLQRGYVELAKTVREKFNDDGTLRKKK